jgi:hypothetical protein
MMTVVGLLLFFGLAGLMLWIFYESLWGVDGDEESEPHP